MSDLIARGMANKATYNIINALDFGVDPTGTRDSTQAIINALNSIDTTKGGKIVFPDGVYLVNGPFQTANGYNARIPLPYVPEGDGTSVHQQPITIEICGVTRPVMAFSEVTGPPNPTSTLPKNTGVIFLCTAAASGNDACIFGGPSISVATDYTSLNVVFRNVTIRQSNPATHIDLDLRCCVSASVEYVCCDINDEFQNIAVPTTPLPFAAQPQSGGVWLPVSRGSVHMYNFGQINLNAYILARQIAVIHSEHMYCPNVFIQDCYLAFGIYTAQHGSWIGHALIQRTTKDFYLVNIDTAAAAGHALINADLIEVELLIPPQSYSDIRVDDTNNDMYGIFNYHVGGLGSGPIPVKNGVNLQVNNLSGTQMSSFKTTTTAPTPGTPILSPVGYPITVYQEVTFNPTSSVAATCSAFTEPNSTLLGSHSSDPQPTMSVPAGSITGMQMVYVLRVPAGWSWQWNVSNAVLGNWYYTAG